MVKARSREVPNDEWQSTLVLKMTTENETTKVEGSCRTGIDESMDFVVKAPSMTQAKELASLAISSIWNRRR